MFLELHKYNADMLAEIATIYSDKNVMRYIRDGKPYSVENIDNTLSKVIKNYRSGTQQGHWAVYNESKEYIGKALLLPWDNKIDFEIGYIVLPRFWGKGYGKQMAKKIFDKAREDGHEKLIATVHRKNKASIRILKDLGFKFKKVVKKEGRRKDLYKWRSNAQTLNAQ
ncbi:MAG: GNAT family N-acetyltransferase [Flavobacteriales bacterium]|nr:GNAT family N-acetyltransferase [Flavobacteriales bacterium]